MNNPEISPDNNENSLRTILRAINFSQGQLSLIFLRCNYAKLRQQISTQIHQVSSIPIREITLTASTKSLYNQISQELGNEQPQALMISGLDSVKNIDVILSLSNQIREEFRKNFPFPILIWIDDPILKTIIRVAPDLESWGSILDFENDTEDLINLIRERTEEIFINDHIPSPQVYQEIEFASQDLQNRGAVINPEIQAGLDLAFGLREYQQDHLDHALNYYQKSGEFWQNYNNTPPALSRTLPLLRGGLERYGIILVKISLVYTRKAEINNDEDLENWQNSRNYLQQALEIFEKARRLDLVIQYINDLGEIFRHLKAWNDLENLAQKSLNLSENVETFRGKSVLSQIWLSQNYGFLAEVALENQDYLKANQYAQQAIDILTKIPNLPTQEYSQYRLFISRSQVGLGEISPAIQTLETAKNQSYHQYNPKLYIAILEKLSFLYFQEKQYLKAFNLKQEKLQIEQQYGFRAFVGASYLNPQRQIINTPLPGEQREVQNLENTATIAREISASGREQDVKRLRTRIAGTQHKLTVIHGQSGVGKSSILQGGLIPALQQEPIGERDAVPIFLRVYTNWIELLGESLKTETLKSTNDQLSPHSTDTIIQKLRKNADKYLLTVLIFDQFEEFFFVYTDKIQRKPFYDFFRICLDIPFVKIVLSLREDYLHYLLELDRLVDLTVTNNNILDKDIRYYLGNFSPPDATTVIQTLTEKTRFYLQAELITELVKELAGDMGEVRPIELQIVGTQLQTEQITTLAKYREFGNKEKVVEKFLEDVIKDCGSEHEQVARLLLYLLTDENNTRPLKTKDELVVQLPESENLDLVLILNIFVASGLVLLLPESPEDRYQLVHDYLVEFIRQQQGNELLAKLAQAQAELKQEKEANQIIETARIKAEAQIKEGQKRLKLSSGLAGVFIVIAGISSVYSFNQLREANIAKREADIAKQVTKLEQSGVNVLRQFQLEELPSLVVAIQNGKTLKTLVKNSPLDKYPTISPIYALNNILDNIKVRNEFQGHQDSVWGVSFSPDGKTIATASLDNTARLWDLQGNLRREFKGHKDYVYTVSFSPDGKTIATASLDKTARLWDLQGNLLQEFKGHQGAVWGVSFSPDGKTIATASLDNTARLWDLQGNLLQEFKGHKGVVTSVSFSPDGKTIATGSGDKTARLWDLQGNLLREFKGHQDSGWGVSFSPDGKTIATGSWDKTARLWDLQGNLLQEFKGHQSVVRSVSFSPDGKTIATGSGDKTARLWDLQGNLLQEFKGHQDWVYSVSFSPDGKTIATASRDNTARLWDLQGNLRQEFKGHQIAVRSVSFSPDGKTIATGSWDKTARLWDLQGNLLQEFKGHQSVVRSVSFSPDGKTIATGSGDKTARLWDLQGNLLQEFKGHQDSVWGVSFSPDGKTIATGSWDNTARLWDLQGNLLQEFKGHQSVVRSVSFSPDGKTIATGSWDNTARLWDLQGNLLQEFKGHQDSVWGVSFSPDGKTIATASDDKTARLWDLQGNLRQEFKGHQGAVWGVSFSPDGKTIATASDDKTARLWDLQGNLLQEFKGHQGAVISVSFSPDGKTIATGSWDKTARLWTVRNLDRVLKDGCAWLRDYLHNREVKLSDQDRRLCDDI
jgi:WD40 repeat protein